MKAKVISDHVSSDIARQVGGAGWLLTVWIITGVLTVIADSRLPESQVPMFSESYLQGASFHSPGSAVRSIWLGASKTVSNR